MRRRWAQNVPGGLRAARGRRIGRSRKRSLTGETGGEISRVLFREDIVEEVDQRSFIERGSE
jgi:hypothetical protein